MRQQGALLLGAAARGRGAKAPTNPVVIGICGCGARARGSARQAGGESARKLRCLLIAAVLAKALQPSVQGSSPPDNRATMCCPLGIAFGAAAGYATYVL